MIAAPCLHSRQEPSRYPAPVGPCSPLDPFEPPTIPWVDLINSGAAVTAPQTRSDAAAGLTARGDRRFRPDIQGLRCVAVILVVLYHCGVPGISGGYVGVDVFFVISGFLITRQLIAEHGRSGRISLSGFYARRIRRLLPSAMTVILLTEVVTRGWGPPLQATQVAKDSIFSTFYLINYRLAIEGVDYQNADGPVSPLQHFWSLAVEEQFYIFWPLAIIAVGLAFRRRVSTALVVLATAATAASLLISIDITDHNATLAYFALQTRGWELGVGAVIAVATPALLRLPRSVAVPASWAGRVLIGSSAVIFTDRTPFPGSAAAVPVLGAGLVVLSGLAGSAAGAESVLRGPLMQFFGRMSYGWYLWHWPLIVLAPAVLHTQFGWPENLAAASIALGLAALGNRFIEQVAAASPARSRRWFPLGGAMSASVTGVALVIMLLPPGELSNGGPAAQLNLAGVDSARMSVLLNDAYSLPRVPSNLSPSLATAVDDRPPTSSDGCNADFLTTRQPPCVFGDPAGTRTVVLFGDSHAEQWFGAVNVLAKARGWKLISWTKAACPLADVLLMSAQLHRPFTECPAWRADTLARISDLHPDLVIASGSNALPGAGYANVDWAAQTAITLSALKRAADRVVYLADVPAPTTNVPVCLAANIHAAAACQFSRGSQTNDLTTANQFPGRQAAVIAAAEQDRVAVIDPTRWLCAASGCPVVVQNMLIYRDATHITQSFSRALAPLVGSALAGVAPWAAD